MKITPQKLVQIIRESAVGFESNSYWWQEQGNETLANKAATKASFLYGVLLCHDKAIKTDYYRVVDFEDLVAREMVHIVPIIRHKLFLDWNFF